MTSTATASLFVLVGLIMVQLGTLQAGAIGDKKIPFDVSLFANTTVRVDNKTLEVADPYGDPLESDGLTEEESNEWEQELTSSLQAQRAQEVEFLRMLQIAGVKLSGTVDNITKAYSNMVNQRRLEQIRRFSVRDNQQQNLVRVFQKDLTNKLWPLLAPNLTDTPYVSSLKESVDTAISKSFEAFYERDAAEADKFHKELKQALLKEQTDAGTLFVMMKNWESSMNTAVKKARHDITILMQKWDMM